MPRRENPYAGMVDGLSGVHLDLTAEACVISYQIAFKWRRREMATLGIYQGARCCATGAGSMAK